MERKTIDLWHPINDKWVHIVQITHDDKIEYFTDGKKEESTWLQTQFMVEPDKEPNGG